MKSARTFRFLVKTPDVEPIASFPSFIRAEEYVRMVKLSGYAMPLEVIDQQKELMEDRRLVASARALRTAIMALTETV
jgi:hypothetical protein